jgi:hypothetical protein
MWYSLLSFQPRGTERPNKKNVPLLTVDPTAQDFLTPARVPGLSRAFSGGSVPVSSCLRRWVEMSFQNVLSGVGLMKPWCGLRIKVQRQVWGKREESREGWRQELLGLWHLVPL